jgi:hypothetical protein
MRRPATHPIQRQSTLPPTPQGDKRFLADPTVHRAGLNGAARRASYRSELEELAVDPPAIS